MAACALRPVDRRYCRIRTRRLAALTLIALLPLAAPAGAAEPPAEPGLTVVLGEGRVTVIRESDLEVAATLPLAPGGVQRWWRTTDGRRLAVVTQEGVFRAKGPARLSVFDLENLRVLGQEDLGYHTQLVLASDDGRVGYVTFAGREAKKGEPASPPSLLRIDSEAGQVTARHPLDALPGALVLRSDTGRLALVWSGEAANDPAKRRPGRIELLDGGSLEPLARQDLPGPVEVFWNGDRSRLYALDAGIDSRQAQRTLPGRVYVVEAETGALAADLELGVGVGPLSWDPVANVFYVLTRPRRAQGAEASLRVLDGLAVRAELELPRLPLGVVPSPDRSRFYVLEQDGITIVDGQLSAILGTIPLKGRPSGLLFLDPPTRAYLSYAGSDTVSAVDLEGRRLLAQITTGRTGKKLGLAAAAGLATGLSQANSLILTGNRYAMAQVVTVPDPQTSGVVSPDGRTAFLYNSQTSDLTAVDTATHQVLAKFAGGRPRFLEGGRLLAAFQATDLALFDLEKRQVLPEVDLGGGLSLCPDGKHLWSLVGIKKGAAVYDLATRTPLRTFPEVWGQTVFVPPIAPRAAGP